MFITLLCIPVLMLYKHYYTSTQRKPKIGIKTDNCFISTQILCESQCSHYQLYSDFCTTEIPVLCLLSIEMIPVSSNSKIHRI